jgi:thiamine-phosphate pyrophosphorylase
MPGRCRLYYITDRTSFSADEHIRRCCVLEKIFEAAGSGVDYIQLREKDLPTRELETLAGDAMHAIRTAAESADSVNRQHAIALLVNSRTDVALTVQAAGVHLRSDDVSPQEVRPAWQKCRAEADATRLEQALAPAGTPGDPIIAVSCHSAREVNQAAINGATLAVFGPVFEKKNAYGASSTGLASLSEACRHKIPVLALGGVTPDNAEQCLDAGAAGIAGIRLFQENDIATVVQRLRQFF